MNCSNISEIILVRQNDQINSLLCDAYAYVRLSSDHSNITPGRVTRTNNTKCLLKNNILKYINSIIVMIVHDGNISLDLDASIHV